MAVKGKPSVKSAKPRRARAVASMTLNEVAVSGVDAGAAGTALNTADAVYKLLLSVKPRALSPEEIANALAIPLGIVTNDLIFLIGVGLVTSAPNDLTRFVAV